MGGALVQIEPSNVGLVSKNRVVQSILCMWDIKDFMEAFKGYDQVLSLEILKTWKEGVRKVNKLGVEFYADIIVEAIQMQN